MTYTTTLSTDVGLARLELGDDTLGVGIMPDGANLTDEQVQVYLDREGSVMRAVAGICEMLATRYASVADLQVGPRRESFSQISKSYATRAAQLRDLYGAALVEDAGAVLMAPLQRVDGYYEAQATGGYA